MGDTKTKTKAAMLNELESIKGLLLEEDDIPILQEVIEHQTAHTPTHPKPEHNEPEEKATPKTTVETKTIYEEQQDFFSSPLYTPPHTEVDHIDSAETYPIDSANDLLETLRDLEKHTEEVTASKLPDNQKSVFARPSLAKATGENPFLPEHIRARLHGNNPPPLFANETARKIATTSAPSRQLGNTFSFGAAGNAVKTNNYQQDIIDSIIEKMMPDIERELRNRLETMSKNMLDELNR
jgi:hypothetical protein